MLLPGLWMCRIKMGMNKNEIAAVFREIGLFLELKGENPFKVRAYNSAARILELLTDDLERLVQNKGLNEIKGIGKTLAENIEELVLTGKLDLYNELRASIPDGLIEMLKISGLGPKKIQILYEKMDIASIRELEYAIKENRLVELPGFGIKTQNRLLLGIEYLKSNQGLYYYAEILRPSLDLIEALKKHSGVAGASISGSMRRRVEVVKDINITASGENPAEIIRYFTYLPQVEDIISMDDNRAIVGLGSGIQVDLKVVAPRDFVYVLRHDTGSREHNQALIDYAFKKGYTLNEQGLFQGDQRIECQDEKEIYKVLGLNYIPPELRENRGEIEWAQGAPFPELVEHKDIKGIFHIHTTMSDGANTLEEMVRKAAELGYEYIGISDHSQSAFYANGLKIEAVKSQQTEIKRLQALYPQIAILSGIESDIKADGSLDYPDDVLAAFDFVIASVHSHFRLSCEDQTQRIMKALSHPAVTMLGHPTGRILLAREGYALDMEKILETARDYGVIIELNSSPARLDIDWRYLRKAMDLGLMISINPDAHRIEELDDVFFGVSVARKGWLNRESVFNCYDSKWIREYLINKKKQT